MSENYKKHEKERDEYMREVFGIESRGPLSPEYLKDSHDIAYRFKEGMNETARVAEEQAEAGDKSDEAKKSLRRDAEDYRKTGRSALEGELKGIKKYVADERVSSAYVEQARSDMERDLNQRKAA